MKIIFDSLTEMKEIQSLFCPPKKIPVCPRSCKECWSRIECEVKEDARVIQKNP